MERTHISIMIITFSLHLQLQNVKSSRMWCRYSFVVARIVFLLLISKSPLFTHQRTDIVVGIAWSFYSFRSLLTAYRLANYNILALTRFSSHLRTARKQRWPRVGRICANILIKSMTILSQCKFINDPSTLLSFFFVLYQQTINVNLYNFHWIEYIEVAAVRLLLKFEFKVLQVRKKMGNESCFFAVVLELGLDY